MVSDEKDKKGNIMSKEELMRRAIVLSIDNVKNGGGPFGAVITKDGEVVATGVNRVTANNDPTSHAEAMEAFSLWDAKPDKIEC